MRPKRGKSTREPTQGSFRPEAGLDWVGIVVGAAASEEGCGAGVSVSETTIAGVVEAGVADGAVVRVEVAGKGVSVGTVVGAIRAVTTGVAVRMR